MADSDRRKLIRSALIVVIAIVVLAVVAIVLIKLFLGSLEASFATPAEYTYSVSVRDLNGASSSGNLEIFVPMPYMNGAPVFSDSELAGNFNNWQSSVVTTGAGKMIRLNNSNGQLNDLVATYYKRIPDRIPVNASADVYLAPYEGIKNQSTDDIRYHLADYLKNSEHTVFYHSSDSLVLSVANDSIIKEKPYESNTIVSINGNIRTPNYRAIAVDLNLDTWNYYIWSYTATNETGNVTLSPVVISGMKT